MDSCVSLCSTGNYGGGSSGPFYKAVQQKHVAFSDEEQWNLSGQPLHTLSQHYRAAEHSGGVGGLDILQGVGHQGN